MSNGMDPEVKRLLRRNLEVSKENNALLKKMRRSAIFGRILLILWWVIIFGLPIYLYFSFLEPYIGGILEALGVEGGLGGLGKNLPPKLQGIIPGGE